VKERPANEWDSIPEGVRVLRHYRSGPDLVECSHGESHRYHHIGVERCAVCRGDEFTTSNFTRPVKIAVRLTKEALEPVQGALF
jgi:hypothetical protein